jgi:hypothetical protein
MALKTEANLTDPDGFYARLLEAHRGLGAVESHALNADLVLILANHVGEREVLDEALRTARALRS